MNENLSLNSSTIFPQQKWHRFHSRTAVNLLLPSGQKQMLSFKGHIQS